MRWMLLSVLLLACPRAAPDAEVEGPTPTLRPAEGSKARGVPKAPPDASLPEQAVSGSGAPAKVSCRYDAAAGDCTVTSTSERGTAFAFSLGGEGALESTGPAGARPPSLECLKANAVRVGTRWPCSRRTLTSGDCPKVAWEVFGFDPSLPGCP